jgi:hypothetical protein
MSKIRHARQGSQDASGVKQSTAQIIPFRTAFFASTSHAGISPLRSPLPVAVRAAVEAYEATGHMLDAALAYAEHGYPISPVTVKSKSPVAAADKDENGNKIERTGAFYKATINPRQIHEWWDGHEYLIALECGPVSGIWMCDVDTSEDHASAGVDGWEKLRAEHPPFETREHRSATGGPHVIFKWDPEHPIGNSSGDLPDGIQIKSQGGYFILPPSRRKQRAYTVYVDIDPQPAPEWLYDLLVGAEEHASNEELEVRNIDELAYGVSLLSNNFKGREEWKTQFAMPLWAATNGSDRGFEIFEEFNSRWSKRKGPIGDTARKVWYDELGKRPPSKAGTGKLYYMIEQQRPGWRRDYEKQVEEDIRATFKDRKPPADIGYDENIKPKPKNEDEYESIKPKNEVQPLPTQKHGDAPATPIEWLVHNRIEKIGPGLMPGQWSTYKTFIVLDLAVYVMLGWDWTGEPVYRQGGVLIFAPEGARSISMRLQGIIDHKVRPLVGSNGLFDPDYPPKPVNLDRLPIEWADSCPPLLGTGKLNHPLPMMVATARAAHDRFMAEHDLPLALIVIDTMATAARFTDESDNAEGSQVLAVMRELAEVTQSFVMAVDHLGKVMEAGSRGASAKEGNADGVLAILADKELSGAVKNTRLALRKVREGPQGLEVPFSVDIVDMGVDHRGNPITSVIIDWQPPRGPTKKDDQWPKGLTLLRNALITALSENGAKTRPYNDKQEEYTVDLVFVRAEFYKSYAAEGTEEQKQARRRQAFNRAIKEAQNRELIAMREVTGYVTMIWFTKCTIYDESPAQNT